MIYNKQGRLVNLPNELLPHIVDITIGENCIKDNNIIFIDEVEDDNSGNKSEVVVVSDVQGDAPDFNILQLRRPQLPVQLINLNI